MNVEDEFRQLAESMPQIVWITTPEGKNRYFNHQWTDFTGLSLEDSYGDGWNRPFHPDDRKRAWEAWQKAVLGEGVYSLECRIRRADGVYKWWLVRGVAHHDAAGQIDKWFGTCTDIDELKQAEIELEKQKNRAEAAAVAKAAFLANMSHEIRTPMNGVMGFLELLLQTKLTARQRRHLTLVQDSAQALLKLLNDILDVSKIEASGIELSAEPTDIRHSIRQCIRLITPMAEGKGLKVEARFADEFPQSVLLDSLRLRQILNNLLGNAVKFTMTGSIVVSVQEVPLDGRRAMSVKISDTGIGIARTRQSEVFDSFVQVDGSVSRRFGGTGLGLTISRDLARLMEGTITLESVEGRGTEVTLVLPLDEVSALPIQEVAQSEPKPRCRSDSKSAPLPGKSILLVEDVDINRELLTEILKPFGHKVDIATNGWEGVELARALQEQPGRWDIIFMDVRMPVMDGLTATRAIRALGGRAATIPIVALTAHAFDAEIAKCLEAGMDDHVAKPVQLHRLQSVIDRWTGDAAVRTPAAGLPGPGTPSSSERFLARLKSSKARLVELEAQFKHADDDATASSILNQTADIAHVLAGTAEMFGQKSLGDSARKAEASVTQVAMASPKRQRRIGGLTSPLVAAIAAAIASLDPKAARETRAKSL